jgi:predicted branched-subunit amino acid permease
MIHPLTADVRRRRVLDPVALRDVAPIALSLMPFAAVIGLAIAHATTVPVWAVLAAGPLLYSGAAHLALVTLLDGGAGPAAIVAAVVVINARLSLYGAAIAPRFHDQPGWFRWLGPHSLVDQTYALAEARPELGGGERFRHYWLTAGAVLLFGWMLAMTAAVPLADLVPDASPLGFASTAVFVALLVPRLRVRSARLPAVLAAGVAIVASELPYGLGLLAGALAGLAPSLLRDRSV